jgi:molybdate transport system ATP-binding protein
MDHQNNPLDSPKPFILLNDITINLNGKSLFERTHWLMESGQQWAIIGPNGSGKPLLANALCGRINTTGGEIRYFFENGDAAGPGKTYFNRGEIVLLSPENHQEQLQQYGLYHQARWQSFEGDEVLTVTDFLSGRNIEHVSPYEVTPLKTDPEVYLSRQKKAVELLGIDYLFPRKLHQLSNGEARKVLMARALVKNPPLLVLDEPCQGLDQHHRQLIIALLDRLCRETTVSMIYVTHYPNEIPAAVTHVLTLSKVQIVAGGKRQDILA